MAKKAYPTSSDVVGFLTQSGPKRTVVNYRANQALSQILLELPIEVPASLAVADPEAG